MTNRTKDPCSNIMIGLTFRVINQLLTGSAQGLTYTIRPLGVHGSSRLHPLPFVLYHFQAMRLKESAFQVLALLAVLRGQRARRQMKPSS
jgi:hypothetical protein